MRDGDADAGLMVLEAAADHLMIESLALLPAHQGRGLGQWMLAFAEQRARGLGLPELRLYTNALMARNLVLYAASRLRRDRAAAHPAPPRGSSGSIWPGPQ